MDYRIEKKEAFRVVGISRPLVKEFEENFKVLPNMWQKAIADGTIQKLVALMEDELMGVLGVSICDDAEEWRYFIAVASTKEIDGNLEEYTVPAATWAVFSGEGTGVSIQELVKRIGTEWLPNSGYEYDNAPELEVYFNDDPQNTKYEIWVPIRKAV